MPLQFFNARCSPLSPFLTIIWFRLWFLMFLSGWNLRSTWFNGVGFKSRAWFGLDRGESFDVVVWHPQSFGQFKIIHVFWFSLFRTQTGCWVRWFESTMARGWGPWRIRWPTKLRLQNFIWPETTVMGKQHLQRWILRCQRDVGRVDLPKN